MFEPSRLKDFVGEPLKAARAKTLADPFSLESLVAWLETKDAATEYDYCEPGDCLVARYVFASGGSYQSGTGFVIGGHSIRAGVMPDTVRLVSQGEPFTDKRWTYGKALERAQAALERLS